MKLLLKYSPWQIEMAMTASLMKLDLLADKQMVKYTHYLLDNEYYDDEMLAILDDDLVHPRGTQDPFQRTISNLRFPDVNTEQAKWIYSYSVIYKLNSKPENSYVFDANKSNTNDKFYDFLDEDSHLQDVAKFKNVIYQLDDALDNVSIGYVQDGYNDPKTVLAMKIRFFDLCQQWINTNQNKIALIFANLYP